MQQQFNLTTKIPAEIFRAYDIRGVAGEVLTSDLVFTIGTALGSQAKALGEDTIITARDGRLSGPELYNALCQGILASGCNVIAIGAVPTPVLYFATNTLKARSGVMLTGSHNPANYNGLKMVLAGKTLSGDDIQALYQRLLAQQFLRGHGRLSTQDVIPTYIKHIVNDVHLAKPLRVVVDCGNGIAGKVAPELFKQLGCEVIPLFCEVDGNFPNHHPDPTVPENLHDIIAAVKKHHADIGLAFDGDGDRLGVVADSGEIIWPDRQMILFAKDVLSRQPNAEIIFDVKSTYHLPKMISQFGGKPVLWKTGHSLLKAKMQERKAPLAGEMSGHIFFKERWFGFDDGLYAGARLLEIIAKDGRPISKIFEELPNSVNTPELKLMMPEANKFSFMEKFVTEAKFDNAQITTIDGLRADFADGWGLVRCSNTTPCLTLRFEADNAVNLKHIQELFRQQLLKLDPTLKLPF